MAQPTSAEVGFARPFPCPYCLADLVLVTTEWRTAYVCPACDGKEARARSTRSPRTTPVVDPVRHRGDAA